MTAASIRGFSQRGHTLQHLESERGDHSIEVAVLRDVVRGDVAREGPSNERVREPVSHFVFGFEISDDGHVLVEPATGNDLLPLRDGAPNGCSSVIAERGASTFVLLRRRCARAPTVGARAEGRPRGRCLVHSCRRAGRRDSPRCRDCPARNSAAPPRKEPRLDQRTRRHEYDGECCFPRRAPFAGITRIRFDGRSRGASRLGLSQPGHSELPLPAPHGTNEIPVIAAFVAIGAASNNTQ